MRRVRTQRNALFATAKEIAFIGLMTALLIACQLALSGLQGIEVVTVLFLAFCYSFGVVRGVIVANCFSLLRCLIWGFFPTVVILYLVYYNLFAVVFGLIGGKLNNMKAVWRIVILAAAAAFMTVLFTLLDDVITPLFFGYSLRAAKVYFYNSLIVLAIQPVCAIVTIAVLFEPLRKAFAQVRRI